MAGATDLRPGTLVTPGGRKAVERQNPLKASAWYAEIGHRFEQWRFAPALSYGYGSPRATTRA